MFADKYLQKNAVSSRISAEADEKLGIVVVIPCLREPAVLATLESLCNCELPKCQVEVIVLINHSEAAPRETRIANQQTKKEVDSWIQKHSSSEIKFFAIGPFELRKKWAGAGLARKYGMDEAVLRFNSINRADGILVSLDADTLVDKNYLFEIERHFLENRTDVGATIAFEHQKEGLDPNQKEGIELYELYLRYYKEALSFAGYPYSMFTVGSAFAVTASAYVKRGGMNRRQAGEDFYFLQNLVQLGRVGEIDRTKVRPSARLSDRVPFGTGPALRKWMEGDKSLQQTYNFQAFADLKVLFQKVNELYQCLEADYNRVLTTLPEAVSAFLKQDHFYSELENLNQNCASPNTFRNRFFQKMNAFRILKFLNFSHPKFYLKADLHQQNHQLQEAIQNEK